jgi:hypothetical protein
LSRVFEIWAQSYDHYFQQTMEIFLENKCVLSFFWLKGCNLSLNCNFQLFLWKHFQNHNIGPFSCFCLSVQDVVGHRLEASGRVDVVAAGGADAVVVLLESIWWIFVSAKKIFGPIFILKFWTSFHPKLTIIN